MKGLVLAAGLGSRLKPFTDHAPKPLVPIFDRPCVAYLLDWLAEAGITNGCGDVWFCPTSWVTRAQMASFLARALDLPPAATDYFADDAGSGHEADINRVAAAGITLGCDEARYCPTTVVTRDQMASFLARALELPATEADHFTDDAGSLHEPDINRIAAAGISNGCQPWLYCPTNPVTREQMAAFLNRLGSLDGVSTPSVDAASVDGLGSEVYACICR